MSALSLAIAIGELFLMPMTRFGFELMHMFPNNFYIKWLSNSLMLCVWNYFFFLGNLSLFLFLPFAYFFIESQGLSFFRRPHRPFLARVSETCVLCCLLIFLLVCIVDLIYTLVLKNESFSFAILYFTSLSTPLLYSFISLIGVFILLLSTPFGFVKMFDVMSGSFLVPPLNSKYLDQNLLYSADILIKKSQIRRNKIRNQENFDNLSLPSSRSLPLLFCDGVYCRNTEKSFERSCNFLNGKINNSIIISNEGGKRNINYLNTYFSIPSFKCKSLLSKCFTVWNSLKYPIMMILLVCFSVILLFKPVRNSVVITLFFFVNKFV